MDDHDGEEERSIGALSLNPRQVHCFLCCEQHPENIEPDMVPSVLYMENIELSVPLILDIAIKLH